MIQMPFSLDGFLAHALLRKSLGVQLYGLFMPNLTRLSPLAFVWPASLCFCMAPLGFVWPRLTHLDQFCPDKPYLALFYSVWSI